MHIAHQLYVIFIILKLTLIIGGLIRHIMFAIIQKNTLHIAYLQQLGPLSRVSHYQHM